MFVFLMASREFTGIACKVMRNVRNLYVII
jgi:hypothetical protein